MDADPQIFEHRTDGPYATQFGKTEASRFAWGLLDLAQKLPIEDRNDLSAVQQLVLDRLMHVLDLDVLYATLAIGAYFNQIGSYLTAVEQAMAQKPDKLN